jgi:NADH:ubiquinone oxidoreductase subunit F (NADH-binding)/(2Fe-2S) ferredoxin
MKLSNEVKVVETGCFGLCEQGPTVVVYPEGVVYCRVGVGDIAEIVESHLLKGRVVERLLYREPAEPKLVQNYPEFGYFKRQVRVVLRNCGIIDPDSIEEYIANGGYQALAKAICVMQPEEIITEIEKSGLRGRGGAGFPTGRKWRLTRQAEGNPKYVVCNADEGEPGTFKDRLILEGDPHSLVEAMAIAGYAVGANKGFIYIRGEYGLSIERLDRAIRTAREFGFLGQSVLGTDFSFDLELSIGAGAYVCGEETALFESLEGRRGEPRVKPPYPAEKGLWGKPTVVNNVETLTNVPAIILKGWEWYRGIGTEKCPGTKVFTMIGDVVNKGLIEVPMGITLREVLYEMGGGIQNGKEFKMAQTGGTSGGCIPKELLDVPMDYDQLAAAGTALGSGALLVLDDTHCIVDVAKCFAKFFVHESCGQCVPCREGTMQIYRILDSCTKGEGQESDMALLADLDRTMQASSLCPLGQTAPFPVMTTLRYFWDEYKAHIKDKHCPTGKCKGLASKTGVC